VGTIHRSGEVWVFDAPLGHLAIGHRQGGLDELIGRSTVYFNEPRHALPILHSRGTPDAILVGSGYLNDSLNQLLDLLRLPGLEEVPVLFSHHHTPKDLSEAGLAVGDFPSNVTLNLDREDTLEIVTRFAKRYLPQAKKAPSFRYRGEGD
jgi:hypothetical protein